MPVVAIHHYTKGTLGCTLWSASVCRSRSVPSPEWCSALLFRRKMETSEGWSEIKSNMARRGGGFAFRLQQQRIDANVSGQRVVWGSAVFGPAQRLIAELRDGVNRKPRRRLC